MTNVTQWDETPSTSAYARQKRWRHKHPKEWAGIQNAYRHANSKYETNASYLSHPFVCWDGEGITLPDGRHLYVMFSVKGGGVNDSAFDPRGLSTVDCFEFVLRNGEAAQPKSIHVIYGGGYDFNMWMGDLPLDILQRTYRGAYVQWMGYKFAWRQGKSFYLARVNAEGKSYDGVTIYDCAPFFQVPFVAACDSYLGERFYRRDIVVKNKAQRSTFATADMGDVREYNDVELTNLAMLMEELRSRLNTCGLRPRRWDGPGAVASALLQREGIKKAMNVSPPEVAEAARYAYAGGRFEVIRFGSVKETVYEYDVNSAYPCALLNVPNLAAGTWRHVKGDPGAQPFALYHVAYEGNNAAIPGAFFRRDPNGTICYPLNVTGWYWSPEVAVGRSYCNKKHGRMKILEAWVFDEGDTPKPFAFIDRLYRMRQVYKAQGNGAHVGIKLGLNSLYGKLAQQVGAKLQPNKVWRIPPFHQLEWAGYVTSHCRATVLRACLNNLDDVIAFETDAVFTSAPLPVPLGTALGEFERTVFESLTYIQSGMYFATIDGKPVEKTRGIDRGQLHDADVQKILQRKRADARKVAAKMTRFIGLGIALAQDMNKWRRWVTLTKQVSVEPGGKRVHMNCACMSGKGIRLGMWHATVCPLMNAAHSRPFPILWINPDPAMTELEEMRNEYAEYD